MTRTLRYTHSALAIALALAGAAPAIAQTPAAQVPAAQVPAGRVPAAEAPPADGAPPARPSVPRKKPAAVKPLADTPVSPPKTDAAPIALPEITVLCEGQSALYDGGKGVPVWVTRSGAVTVQNPLRPLTPETTRVLQVVVGGKAATAYGPDLLELRRGTTPAALEASTGGTIRWDAELALLPDFLNIVSEAGEPLAQLRFKECGTAPVVPVAEPAKAKKPPARPATSPRPAVPAAEPSSKVPPGLQLPQGAIQ